MQGQLGNGRQQRQMAEQQNIRGNGQIIRNRKIENEKCSRQEMKSTYPYREYEKYPCYKEQVDFWFKSSVDYGSKRKCAKQEEKYKELTTFQYLDKLYNGATAIS